MAGLKICTRCRAISARRKRRISSSLFPENMGPTTTSIQPILPLTMSTLFLLRSVPVPLCDLRSRTGSPNDLLTLLPCLPKTQLRRGALCAIQLRVVEWRKRRNHRHAKRFLPRNQITRQHAPRPLRVAYAGSIRTLVDRHRQLHAFLQHLVGHRFWTLYPARQAKISALAIRHVSPTLQKYSPLASPL